LGVPLSASSLHDALPISPDVLRDGSSWHCSISLQLSCCFQHKAVNIFPDVQMSAPVPDLPVRAAEAALKQFFRPIWNVQMIRTHQKSAEPCWRSLRTVLPR